MSLIKNFKNGQYKNWLRNLIKERIIKNGNAFAKKEITTEIFSKFREIMQSTSMTIREIKEVSSLANDGVLVQSGKAKKEMIEANLD